MRSKTVQSGTKRPSKNGLVQFRVTPWAAFATCYPVSGTLDQAGFPMGQCFPWIDGRFPGSASPRLRLDCNPVPKMAHARDPHSKSFSCHLWWSACTLSSDLQSMELARSPARVHKVLPRRLRA